jgi:hypothetical protein
MQTLLQIHQRAQRRTLNGTEVDWEAMAKDIESTRPFLDGQVLDMCTYVKEYSGGADPVFLKELDEWSKCLQTRRDIPGAMFKLLAKVPFAQGAKFITMCVKALLVAPEQYCKDNVSKLLTSTDLASISGKSKNLALHAVELTRAAHAYLLATKAPAAIATKLVGEMEVRFVMTIFQKKAKSRLHFNTLEEATAFFVAQVQMFHPAAKETPNPWGIHVNPPTSTSSSTASSIRQFSGSAFDVSGLQASGLSVGVDVLLNADEKIKFTIVKLGDIVELRDAEGESIEITAGQLVDEYKADGWTSIEVILPN